jgi:hypothetical protein
MDSISRNRLILGIAAIVILITPVAVYAASFLDIRLAHVKTTSDRVSQASFVTKASIPKDGSGGAFGYGIITGTSVVIVTTTHKGVLDSEAQNDNANKPVFHNHYVNLGNDARCGSDPAVVAITFDSPGKVSVGGSSALLKNLPKSSEGLTQNNKIDGVVSFTLAPNDGAVCVKDIKPAEKLKVN